MSNRQLLINNELCTLSRIGDERKYIYQLNKETGYGMVGFKTKDYFDTLKEMFEYIRIYFNMKK